jgi:DNA helicase-2/ATP-dependent DNA helicase PcrA
MEGLRQAGQEKLVGPAAAGKIAKFISIMDHLDTVFRQTNPLELLTEVIDRSGYSTMLNNEDTRESKARMENLNELYSAVEQSVEDGNSSLREFLDSTALVADLDNLDDERGVLPLMTLHTCKGLEFSAVFLVGMENGLLPHASSMSDSAEYEEERRLCYVGFTRAKKRLFVSHARRRRIYGNTFNYMPSDFLNSIPDEVMQRESSTPDYTTNVPFADNAGTSFPRETESEKSYSIGTKVLHPKFGSGIVINRSGEEEDLKLEVFFKDGHGKKKLAANLANLIII